MIRTSISKRLLLLLRAALCAFALAPSSLPAAEPVDLTPVSCCDGQFTVTNVLGASVWQNIGGNIYLYFDIPANASFSPGQPLHVRVVYADLGQGRLRLQYDSIAGNSTADFYRSTDVHMRSSRVDTQTFATNYHELADPALLGRQNGGADFRLMLTDGGAVPLSVRRVTVQDAPFADDRWQYILSRPWAEPYSGPTREDVDTSSLRGRVMVGWPGCNATTAR